jgi:hypothetical protein
MNGYLFTYYENISSNLNTKPFSDDVTYRLTRLEPNKGIVLYTWGSEDGDVYISCRNSYSILIMAGYITEAPKIQTNTKQQEVCNKLREIFDTIEKESDFENIVEKLNGSFSIIYMCFNKKLLISLTDRIASRHIWYKNTKDAIFFSSHSIPITRKIGKKTLSPGAVLAYMLYGAPVDPQISIFSGIFSQKEGTIIRHDLFGPEKIKEWYRFKHFPEKGRSIGSWVHESSRFFIEAAQRIKVESNPLLFLSGGVDSRLSGAALIAAGIKPLLCTMGDSINLEVKVAKAVAGVFKCQHEIIVRDVEWYLRGIEKAVFNSNGLYVWCHSHFSQAYERLRRIHKIDTVIIGDFCEAFSKLFCESLTKREKVWTENEFIDEYDMLQLPNYRPVNRNQTLKLFKTDFRTVAEKELRSAIKNRYAEVKHCSTDPLIVGDHFFRWQNTGCLATFQMFNDIRSVASERNLMFDKNLHHLLEIMPSSLRNNSNFGARLIRCLCQGAAVIPNANSMMPLMIPIFLQKLTKKLRPKMGKIRRKIFSDDHRTTASWSHLPMLYARNPAWKNKIVTKLIEENNLPDEIFDKSSVMLTWKKFCNGDVSLFADIEKLIGLAILSSLLR